MTGGQVSKLRGRDRKLNKLVLIIMRLSVRTHNGCAIREPFARFPNESPHVDLRNGKILNGGPHHTVFNDGRHVQVQSDLFKHVRESTYRS